TYEVSGMGQVPCLDAVATFDSVNGKTALFVLNRDLSKTRTIEINWQGNAPSKVLAANVLTGDLKTGNSFDAPTRVTPRTADKQSTTERKTTFEVPPHSYTVVQWGS